MKCPICHILLTHYSCCLWTGGKWERSKDSNEKLCSSPGEKRQSSVLGEEDGNAKKSEMKYTVDKTCKSTVYKGRAKDDACFFCFLEHLVDGW